MVKCHKCGHNNEEGHEFCEECGSKLKVELKCKKCGLHLKPDDDFCEECGANVKESKAPHHERKTESKLAKYKWWIISAVIVLLLGSIFVFAVPLPYEAKEGYTEKVPYEAQEGYTEKEPYSTTETSTKQESYNTNVCKQIELFYTKTKEEYIGASAQGGECTKDKADSNNQCLLAKNIYIKNLDSVAGDFSVICTFSNGVKVIFGAGRLEPLSEDFVQCWKLYNLGETLWLSKTEVVPPTKEDCQLQVMYRDVPTDQTVTKYRDVTKTKTITKYKDEYKERFVTKYASLFQQWSGQAKYYYKV